VFQDRVAEHQQPLLELRIVRAALVEVLENLLGLALLVQPVNSSSARP
jgi:hypothetical protein